MNSIVPDTWKIPPQLAARFGDNAGRQRAMNAEGHLLLVLHDPPNPNEQGRQTKLLWRAPDGAWACNTDGSVSDLLKKHVASFAERAEDLESKMQEASCADDYFYLLQAIAPLHRSSRNLHATLQQARDMMSEDRAIIVARDSAGDIERTFELLHLDAKNGLDYTVARKSELQSQQTYEMALSAHRLNVLAAIFFPITALSSIFAMNPALAPELLLHTPIFWTVIGAGSLCGLLLSRSIVQKPVDKSDSKIAITKSKSRYGAKSRNQTNQTNQTNKTNKTSQPRYGKQIKQSAKPA
jgi:Mg2+ and Co2+ transporter CorA